MQFRLSRGRAVVVRRARHSLRARGRARRRRDAVEHLRAHRDPRSDPDLARRRPSASRWSRAPSTTRSTRSTAATSRISPRHRPTRGTRRTPQSRLPPSASSWPSCPSQLARPSQTQYAAVARWRFPTAPQRTGGIAAGEAAAAAMLAARANDGRDGPFPFVFGTTPGVWRPSPPLSAPDPTPWVGNVTPFLVPNAEMLRTKGPNALTSKAYARDLNEVKSIGSLSSTTRTADQTKAAIFWQAHPVALYGGVMRSLSARFGLTTARERTAVREGEPRRRRRRHRLLERQVLLELLAADRRDPRGGERRQPGDRGRPHLAAALRPGDADDARARRRRTSRTTRPGTAA